MYNLYKEKLLKVEFVAVTSDSHLFHQKLVRESQSFKNNSKMYLRPLVSSGIRSKGLSTLSSCHVPVRLIFMTLSV